MSRTGSPLPDDYFPVFSKFLNTKKRSFIIIDGIDEIQLREQDELCGFVETLLGLPECVVKIFMSCRPEAVSQKKAFHPPLSITISPELILDDIRSFVEMSIEEKMQTGDLVFGDPGLRHEIIDRLTIGAKEMRD